MRIEPATKRELELTAEMLGVPMAEVIRRGVARVRAEHVLRQAEATGGRRAAGFQR